MDHSKIINELRADLDVFSQVLSNKSEEKYLWKPEPDKWCLLEIVCHLYDEEKEDFRTRVKYTLETPEKPLPMFDPSIWAIERKYKNQNYHDMVQKFLQERASSIDWLLSLQNAPWKNAYNHPKLGPLSSEHFLANWLAHDYLHIRQIYKLQFQYLEFLSGMDLSYAGEL